MPKRSAKAMMMKAIPSTSSQQPKPEKRTRTQTSSANSVSANQRSMTQSMTPCNINNLPDKVFDEILMKLETHEQCKLRRVCHKWKFSIEKLFALIRCLKVNLIDSIVDCPMKPHSHGHKWAPNVSIRSLQFDSNWTEPTLELYKKAQVTVHRCHFSVACANALARLFSRVQIIVIYFDLMEYKRSFNNFIRMIEGFKMLESFSLIRETELWDHQFIPKLCATLEGLSPFRRLDLYVDLLYDYNGEDDDEEVPKANIPLIKSIECLEHFALSCWPPGITPENRATILQNVGALLKNGRKIMKKKQLELSSLRIPVNQYDSKSFNMAQMFNGNAELQNVKRLQFTDIMSIEEVKSTLALCSKLQSLELYMKEQKEIDTNSYIEMVNQCEQLTELKLFNAFLTPFEPGSKAAQIQKLTVVTYDLFGRFKRMMYEQEIQRNFENPGDEQLHGFDTAKWLNFNKIADEFVRLITLKFPSLEELTVLTNEFTTTSCYGNKNAWLILKKMIIKKLKAMSTSLTMINLDVIVH